jgi:hypothetical protein
MCVCAYVCICDVHVYNYAYVCIYVHVCDVCDVYTYMCVMCGRVYIHNAHTLLQDPKDYKCCRASKSVTYKAYREN